MGLFRQVNRMPIRDISIGVDSVKAAARPPHFIDFVCAK
jgi:hypothetical protein